MSPGAQFLVDLMALVTKALEGDVPPERLAQYLRDMADDVMDKQTH